MREQILILIIVALHCVSCSEAPSERVLGLVMIVKDEGSTIVPTLETLERYLDFYTILDTGSKDNTVEAIQTYFGAVGIPGRIFQEPFIDFAASRNRALDLHAENTTYALMIDAEWFVKNPKILYDFCVSHKGETDLSAYDINIGDKDLTWHLPRLIRTDAKPRFSGVVHEALALVKQSKPGPPEVFLEVRPSEYGGKKTQQRWVRDKGLLQKEIFKDPLNSRTMFYLAQTYSCLRDNWSALSYYRARDSIIGWEEEDYMTKFRMSRAMEGYASFNSTIRALKEANAFRPTRPEAIHTLAEEYYYAHDYENCFKTLQEFLPQNATTDKLFVEHKYYKMRYELMALCAMGVGNKQTALEMVNKVIDMHTKEAYIFQYPTSSMHTFKYYKASLEGNTFTVWPSVTNAVYTACEDETQLPTITLAIITRNSANFLELFLESVVQYSYPKDKIHLYIVTNNNDDTTTEILEKWLEEPTVKGQYASVKFNMTHFSQLEEDKSVEWTDAPHRFPVMAQLRQMSIEYAQEINTDFYFTVDTDNFLAPHTLLSLVQLNREVVAPMLDSWPEHLYSNYWDAYDVDTLMYAQGPRYIDIRLRKIMGVFEMPLVHCVYLIRNDALSKVSYKIPGWRDFWEFIVFSKSLRDNGVPQLIDNRYKYGFLLHEDKKNPIHKPTWRKLYNDYIAQAIASISKQHFSYVGCFEDEHQRTVNQDRFISASMTIEQCRNYCRKGFYRYSAIQMGAECFCSDHLPLSKKKSDFECSTPCVGNKLTTCGAGWRNSVYMTYPELQTADEGYQGCYEDGLIRDMGRVQWSDRGMTIRKCRSYCGALSYLFAGVQAGTECYCDNSFGGKSRVGDSLCSTDCGGDKLTKCGGGYFNSVYASLADGIGAEHIITSPFTKIYVVNHRAERARWARMKSRLQEYASLLNRVDAIEVGSGINMLMSHLYIWQEMVTKNIDRVLILEDTAILQPYQLTAMAAYVAEADSITNATLFGPTVTSSKWDILFFGAHGNGYKADITTNLEVTLVSRGSYAYALNIKAARELSQMAPGWVSVDDSQAHLEKVLDRSVFPLNALAPKVPLVHNKVR